MKKALGILLIAAAIGLGLFVPIYFLVIPGINHISDGANGHPVGIGSIAWGIVLTVLFAPSAGFGIMGFFGLAGYLLLGDEPEAGNLPPKPDSE